MGGLGLATRSVLLQGFGEVCQVTEVTHVIVCIPWLQVDQQDKAAREEEVE